MVICKHEYVCFILLPLITMSTPQERPPPEPSPQQPPPPPRPPASLNGADWGTSDAKHLIVQDMLDGLVPYDEKIKDVKKLFDDMYAHQPEFVNFPFDEQRYKDRIKRIQDAVKKLKWARDTDSLLLAEARAKFGFPDKDPTGKKVWRGSEAAKLLDEDMAAGKHLVEGFKPSKLWEERPEYKDFSKRRFSKRIDQKKEAAKPYGKNPQQAADDNQKNKKNAKGKGRKLKDRPDISRKGVADTYSNDG